MTRVDFTTATLILTTAPTAERRWTKIEIYLIGGKQMKTTEVIKQLLLQIETDDPKNEALITAIVTILNKCETKKEEPKKRGRPAGSKKPFDIGKAKACREAGWSIAKIADEMRVSTATVSTKLKEAGMNITAVMDA